MALGLIPLKGKDKSLPLEAPKTGTHPNTNCRNSGTQTSFKPKLKRKRIIGSLPLFKTETLDYESETDSVPVQSKYINDVLRRKVSHDPTFGVYQDDTDGSFKIRM